MKKDRQIKTTMLLLVIILLISITFSYAYFTMGTNNDNQEMADLKTGTVALTFEDNDEGINEKLMIGKSVTKKFKITNLGTLEASLSLDFDSLINTYLNGSLSYNLTYSPDENGEYEEIIPKTNMPVSSEPLTQTLAPELSVPAEGTYYYNLTITYNNTDFDQRDDIDAVYSTRFDVGDPIKYRYYTLNVDPNGGTWGEYASTQEYLLKNKETFIVSDLPTRTGYTFAGWELSGVSSTLKDGIFSMGISNAKLTARWSANKHTVTIDKDGSFTTIETEYNKTVDLGEPPYKEGYTFTGWQASGGIIEGNNLSVTIDEDIRVTPTYAINRYKYIVYHRKQNINDDGYTIVSADTDEGEANYNTMVSPEVKSYTGFNRPSAKTLTIKHETEYPPVLNKVEYNYNRNRYTLTINANGGNYSGSTSQTLKYEQSVVLSTPSKTGYNFTNWTTTSGTIDGSTFKIGASDATVTANYTPQQFTVTFNANGGSTPTSSKTVTYTSTYGSLPTPTYAGYKFLGWFTESSGGTEVTDSTTVSITANQTLYAHWERNTVTVTLVATNSNACTNCELYFDNTSVTTKTIEVVENGVYGDLPTPKSNNLPGTNFSCQFQGFYTSASGGTKITSTTKLISNSPHTLYAQWSCWCFSEDTLIFTPDGYRKIQDIKVGDEVYSFNEESKKVEVSDVNQTFVHTADSILHISFEDGTKMQVTPNHLIYDNVEEKWKPIGEFDIGDCVRNEKGESIKIESIKTERGEFKVFNFEVDKNHTYFVTNSNILAHNKAS